MFESNLFWGDVFDFLILMLIPLAFLGVKVLMLRYFEFTHTKKTLIHYGVMYGVLTVIMIIVYLILRDVMQMNQIVSAIYLPLVLLTILYEYLVVHKNSFDFEPKGQFAFMMVLSYVAHIMVLLIAVPIYLLILFLLLAISRLF